MKRRASPTTTIGSLEEGPPSTTEVEETMLDRAAQRAAGLVTPAREPVKVLLARSDEVDQLNDLARDPEMERVARGAAGDAAASRSEDGRLSPAQHRRRARGAGLRGDH